MIVVKGVGEMRAVYIETFLLGMRIVCFSTSTFMEYTSRIPESGKDQSMTTLFDKQLSLIINRCKLIRVNIIGMFCPCCSNQIVKCSHQFVNQVMYAFTMQFKAYFQVIT